MNTPIIARNLTQQAPHSPRDRIGGFVIASRAVDKCRASLAGTLGDYHYDCPLDNQLFSFKGINGEQFKAAVQASASYEDVGAWLQTTARRKRRRKSKPGRMKRKPAACIKIRKSALTSSRAAPGTD